MTKDSIAALEEALLRQNAALDAFNATFASLGDVVLHVPATFIDELDEIAKRCEPKTTETFNGLRA